MEKTLILCASLPEGLAYYRQAQKRGEKVVATSSLAHDETARFYDTWEWLPDIYDTNFLNALTELTRRHPIKRIYCPHHIVFEYLEQLREEGKLTLPLIGKMPIIERTEELNELLAQADEAQQWIRQITGGQALPLFRIATILRQAEATYGESAPAKLIALMAAFALGTKGDVVEIGSWWGKTAVTLAMLARDYHAGAVLCVDPWQGVAALQKEAPFIAKNLGVYCDWDKVFTGFTVNVAAVATPGRFNYIRLPSAGAEAKYRKNKTIRSPEFGEVTFEGRIALIHIDGNHDYASVRQDYEAWRPYVVPGGWVVLDDYVWQHGDGPRRLGDEVLQAEREQIQLSFVAGKALFLQFC